MSENPLNFTNLTYDKLMSDVQKRMTLDSRFENFRQSSMYALISEIFGATTDFTNYYIERRAEESYLDTAKLRSSVILLARMLGYISSRPIPASTAIKMTLRGPLPSNTVAGDKIYLKGFETRFDFNGIPFLIKKTYTYTLTSEDVINGTSESFSKEILYSDSEGNLTSTASSEYTLINVIQGEIKYSTFSSSEYSSEVGKKFQMYNIDDDTFSNFYGTEDIGYDTVNGISYPIYNLTRVGVTTISDPQTYFSSVPDSNAKSLDGEFIIDRRSFAPTEAMDGLVVGTTPVSAVGENSRFCILRTALDDTMELLFADNNLARIGLNTNNEYIHVKYLSTLGSEANQTGVLDSNISLQSGVEFSGESLSNNIEFSLYKNITGGYDSQDIDSIKLNAPEIYYSLDKCVTSKDYIAFLKSITSPIVIKNAIAWGEQEEIRTEGTTLPNKKFFNVSPFCALGSLYKSTFDGLEETENVILRRSTNESQESIDKDVNYGINDYFNILVKDDPNYPLSELENGTVETESSLYKVYEKLRSRAQATVKNIYIAPIIHDFKLTGSIYVSNLTDKDSVKDKVETSIYTYLNDNVDFSQKIYKSNIIELIEQYPEVKYANISLSAVASSNQDATDGMILTPISIKYPQLQISAIINEWTSGATYRTLFNLFSNSSETDNETISSDDSNLILFRSAINYRNLKFNEFLSSMDIGDSWTFDNFKKKVSYTKSKFEYSDGEIYYDLIENGIETLYSGTDLIKNILSGVVAGTSLSSSNKITALVSEFGLTKAESVKYSLGTLATKLVWPNRNDYRWNTSACKAVETDVDHSDGTITKISQNEREFYLTIMACYYNKLKAVNLTSTTEDVSALVKALDKINASERCIGCSLKNLFTTGTTTESGLTSDDVTAFFELNTDDVSYFEAFMTKLHNSFVVDIRKNMVDENGNITTYSMKNEIVRIESFDSSSFVYK